MLTTNLRPATDPPLAMITTVLLVFAFVCAVLASFGVGGRFNLTGAALAFYFASLLFGR